MRKLFSIISISALLVLAMTSAVKAEESVEVEIGYATVPSSVVLRSEPSGSSTKLGVLTEGTSVPVYEIVGNWYRVLYDGMTGYVSAGYVEYIAGHCLEIQANMSTNECTDPTVIRTYCIFCGYVESETIIKPALGHDLFTVYVAPDMHSPFNCETGGVKVTSCRRASACRYTKYEEIPPGHVYTEVSYIKPTYHSNGTQTMECSRCGHRDYITIPMLIDDGMSPDVFAMGQAFLSGAWKLFGIYVPGFGFTFGGMYIGIILVGLSLTLCSMIFGFGGRRGGSVSARSGSTNKAKISKERENDER